MVQPRPTKVSCSASTRPASAVASSSARTASASAMAAARSSPRVARSRASVGRREPGLHDRLLVDLGHHELVLGERGDRRAGRGDDRGGGLPAGAQRLEQLDHLGRRAGPGDRHDVVVVALERELAGRVGLGVAVAGRLPQGGVGLGHVERRAAAGDRDARAPAGRAARASGTRARTARQSAGWVAISVARWVVDTTRDSCRERMRLDEIVVPSDSISQERLIARRFDRIAQRNAGKIAAKRVDEHR